MSKAFTTLLEKHSAYKEEYEATDLTKGYLHRVIMNFLRDKNAADYIKHQEVLKLVTEAINGERLVAALDAIKKYLKDQKLIERDGELEMYINDEFPRINQFKELEKSEPKEGKLEIFKR